MKKIINEFGKEVWTGLTNDSVITFDMFYEVTRCDGEDITQAIHTNLGSITVLDRMTGFGYRDVETGYRAKDGKFWLASGNFDVLDHGCVNIGQMINLIKINSNTCVGV